MKSFFDVYSARMNPLYQSHVWTRYRDFIHLIQDEITHSQVFAEFGCGSANVSRLLGNYVKHLLVDIDPKMLDLAKQNMSEARLEFLIKQADIREPFKSPRIDLIHSHGVLEHFKNAEIRKIISNQLVLSNTLMHYVPSAKYDSPSFGDERLLTPAEWRKICEPTEIVEFNDGFDLILVWRK